MRRFLGILAVLLAAAFTPSGQAQAEPHAYALVIGSNRGGSGQATLQFAQRDAERVSELLRELGRTPSEHIERLGDPTVAEIEAAVRRIEQRLRAHAERGQQAQLLFYYSGHARAHALSLGDQELELARLRRVLLALPSTLTVVVLDACQSGAFSGVKGASPAADFSISSVRNLRSSGVAVMASSTGTELSQESKELGSSYFTHHLLMALRGAGDVDRNGRVSLDEAYRYAYDRTLSDTARTKVGSQHATLETELTGAGDVPLTYPVDADAQLTLPKELAGRVLVQREKRGAVIAELVKAAGTPLSLALPSGRYQLLLRDDGSAYDCELPLARGAVHSLVLTGCARVELPAQESKIAGEQALEVHSEEARAPETWFLELGFMTQSRQDDAYMRSLQLFGFGRGKEHIDDRGLGFDAAIGARVFDNLQLVVRGFALEYGGMYRSTQRGEHFDWNAHAVTAGFRARAPLYRHYLAFIAEGTAGLGFARSVLMDASTAPSGRNYEERTQNLAVRGQAGLIVGFSRHFGAYFTAGYVYARLLENEQGERHQSGGVTFTHGLRINATEGWW